jgi:hypothetical protein
LFLIKGGKLGQWRAGSKKQRCSERARNTIMPTRFHGMLAVSSTSPVLIAGLLYLGSGVGLAVLRMTATSVRQGESPLAGKIGVTISTLTLPTIVDRGI